MNETATITIEDSYFDTKEYMNSLTHKPFYKQIYVDTNFNEYSEIVNAKDAPFKYEKGKTYNVVVTTNKFGKTISKVLDNAAKIPRPSGILGNKPATKSKTIKIEVQAFAKSLIEAGTPMDQLEGKLRQALDIGLKVSKDYE